MMDERSDHGGEKMEDIMLPGFRFHPTDEELVGFYLKRKIQQRPLTIELIKQIDIYKYDPWDLPKLAPSGEKEWYFFCPRDRKYRNSARPNRVTGAGFWKATGTDRPIYSSEGSKCIGLRKSLVFYRGRAAKGVKTDWMMHEFRLPSLTDPSAPKRFLDKTIPANDSWAICRIFKKTNTTAHRAFSQSWMSPQPETTTSSHHNHHHNMSSFTTKTSFYGDHNNNVQQSSSASFSPILDHSINNPMAHHHHHHYQTPNSTISNGLDLASTFMFSPLDPSPPPPRCSSSVVDDVSSMLLNMSSSVLGGFGESFSSQDQDQCNNINGFSLLSSLIPNHHQHEMQSQGSDGSEEINDLNGVVLRNIHGDEEQWNIGFPLMNIVSPHDAWKSSFVWDTSPCPTEMSTTKCYT